MRYKKEKRNLLTTNSFSPFQFLERFYYLKNNYSIAERGEKVKETRGLRPVFQSR